MRIGHGYDAHRFAAPEDQRALILGGVTIPHDRGLLAHSDGDALIHALCDAILGALALGDIGRHFPDTAAEFKNADSAALLNTVMALAEEGDWQVVNADMTILAQAPKMAPHIAAMQTRLASLLKIDSSRVNVKASTTEKMGFVGRQEGIETYAVVLLARAD
ncbi:2-C-methyl-D-erythritol 2,4-cyclodiphosphate synthase [Pseudohongiella nitratireducens]|uniref:2-C-methyl-D-erythritol 2,4-cyclodiphosphate synthase n=1 Tax=Pseudohongiella nitratireducens TaxID=1768907 RepID=UPI00083A5655|nr:2-C-methyl-D-erythritol 2,4-cyclodiphosphate synthase [Pseudohongiella nitratireducens]MDF1624491.1 2-C-methyl-D-erythritol 2,4-cyclodiphosphate synthase [Pseudohongiella nitratireducens]